MSNVAHVEARVADISLHDIQGVHAGTFFMAESYLIQGLVTWLRLSLKRFTHGSHGLGGVKIG